MAQDVCIERHRGARTAWSNLSTLIVAPSLRARELYLWEPWAYKQGRCHNERCEEEKGGRQEEGEGDAERKVQDLGNNKDKDKREDKG